MVPSIVDQVLLQTQSQKQGFHFLPHTGTPSQEHEVLREVLSFPLARQGVWVYWLSREGSAKDMQKWICTGQLTIFHTGQRARLKAFVTIGDYNGFIDQGLNGSKEGPYLCQDLLCLSAEILLGEQDWQSLCHSMEDGKSLWFCSGAPDSQPWWCWQHLSSCTQETVADGCCS